MAFVIDQTEAQNILKATFQKTAYPTISACQLRLMTANGTSTTNGTQVTGGTYAGQTLAMNNPVAQAITNTSIINFTGMPASTSVGIEIWTTVSPRRLWLGSLSASKTVDAGDTLSFAAGVITAQFS